MVMKTVPVLTTTIGFPIKIQWQTLQVPAKLRNPFEKSGKCHAPRRRTWWFLRLHSFTEASNLICFIDFQSKSNGVPSKSLPNCEIPLKNHVNVVHLGDAHGGFSVTVVHESVKLYTFL